ncbi:hypothetical protein [Krasilnikovia sp. M28-CT-15]
MNVYPPAIVAVLAGLLPVFGAGVAYAAERGSDGREPDGRSPAPT